MGPNKITQEDQQFNISFVGEVKKHMCLFDSNSSEYKQAAMQDKAWSAVSAAVDESVDTCKKRWRNLRCCMTRYLKSLRDNNEVTSPFRRKPYYLYQHMQFVLPYLKVKDEPASNSFEADDSNWSKPNSSAVPVTLIKNNDGEETEEEPPEIETIDVEEDHHQLKQSIIQSIKILGQETQTHPAHERNDPIPEEAATATTTTTTYEIIAAPPPSKQARLSNAQPIAGSASPTDIGVQTGVDTKKDLMLQRQFYTLTGNTAAATSALPMFTSTPLAHQPQATAFAQPAPGQLQPQTAQQTFALIQTPPTVANDADHNFFQSLVPDIQSMTMEQKRKLKIGILQLIDTILNS
ncbi:uncharacterized protein LOC131212896 [Anopheles bellator]|uniref:uncharacterized protein LOC131212896 n=1 Tax=Anopheles bellator TaxID=139047 RepID=UPI0026493323|nr:uncharacterized protein LOC131212896 [Anopheles bellator]